MTNVSHFWYFCIFRDMKIAVGTSNIFIKFSRKTGMFHTVIAMFWITFATWASS